MAVRDNNQVFPTVNLRNYKSKIVFEKFEKLDEEDKIYIDLFSNHSFVLLHRVKEKVCYIADCTNGFIELESVQDHFNRLVNMKLIAIPTNLASLKTYHCGSDAIFITLKFVEFYRKGEIDDLIPLQNSKLVNKIKQEFQ